MTTLRITPANAALFPMGTRVRFFNGCGWHLEGPQEEIGVVVGWRSDEWQTELEVVTESDETRFISQFTTVGIGARLIDVPAGIEFPAEPV